MSVCRSCGAPIRWVPTGNGRVMPLDLDPVPHGNVVPVERDGQMIAVVHGPDDGRPVGPAWVSHFATCPDAGAHRKGPRT